MIVFWDVEPCNLVEIDRRLRGAYCLNHSLIMEAVSTSETSVNFYQISERNIPENSHLHNRRRENLKSHSSNELRHSCTQPAGC
jgi:hypothetical protein